MSERRVSAVRRFGGLARLGHFARGVVYLVMGAWAGRAAIVTHARALGPGEALRGVIGAKQGHLVIGFVACGFLADALFRLIQAATAKNRGVVGRISLVGRGIGSAALGVTAFQIYRDVRLNREGNALREIIGWILAHAWGPKVIVAVGAIAGIAGTREIAEGLSGRLRETFVKKTMGRFQARWSVRLTRLGLMSHGILILVMGYFLVRAGLNANPRGVVESGGALRRVGSLPYGSALLAGIAVGLVAYGLSQWVFALYRRPS